LCNSKANINITSQPANNAVLPQVPSAIIRQSVRCMIWILASYFVGYQPILLCECRCRPTILHSDFQWRQSHHLSAAIFPLLLWFGFKSFPAPWNPLKLQGIKSPIILSDRLMEIMALLLYTKGENCLAHWKTPLYHFLRVFVCFLVVKRSGHEKLENAGFQFPSNFRSRLSRLKERRLTANEGPKKKPRIPETF